MNDRQQPLPDGLQNVDEISRIVQASVVVVMGCSVQELSSGGLLNSLAAVAGVAVRSFDAMHALQQDQDSNKGSSTSSSRPYSA